MASNTIITLNRQYGSGGTEVAKKLADELGFKYYDKELISLASKESGYTETFFENADEKPSNSLLYSIVSSTFSTTGWFYPVDSNIVTNDKLFNIQAGVIRTVASESNCVIVGRCANFILRNEEKLLSIFTKASMGWRIENIRSEHPEMDDKELETYLKKADKTRSNYYNYYTGQDWEHIANYDLVLSPDIFGIDGSVEIVKKALEVKGLI